MAGYKGPGREKGDEQSNTEAWKRLILRSNLKFLLDTIPVVEKT